MTTRKTKTRAGHIHRKTKETDIRVSLVLDGGGTARISTGVPFLDHMLELFAKHGLFDLEIACKGDLHIDDHHTVEDIAICLARHSTVRSATKPASRVTANQWFRWTKLCAAR